MYLVITWKDDKAVKSNEYTVFGHYKSSTEAKAVADVIGRMKQAAKVMVFSPIRGSGDDA